eukprot:GHVL01018880.1.p1 GENE.GHVL01018880.1~~GHVL01018880.1.p1  ORF type:complete len:492 (+),score=88.67 GHVL01018880.1:163-1638(+)
MKNDEGEVIDLIQKGASPVYCDEKNWSPLMWAACHGNETLVRFLISNNSCSMYQQLDPVIPHQTRRGRVKHTPLHWAAFKGHLRVLWLLIRQGLSVNQVDIMGNTVLHQAAAGGHQNIVECLLSQGVDVHAKNDRTHNCLLLCTNPPVLKLLKSALDANDCFATGIQFSHNQPKYMCSSTGKFYIQDEVVRRFVYHSVDDEEEEEPVTWHRSVHKKIQNQEDLLKKAIESKSLKDLDQALASSDGLKVNPKLRAECLSLKSREESCIVLATRVEELGQIELLQTSNIYEISNYVKSLVEAIQVASDNGVTGHIIEEAKKLESRLVSEMNLLRCIVLANRASDSFVAVIENLTQEVLSINNNSKLISTSNYIVGAIKYAEELQFKISEALFFCPLDDSQKMTKYAPSSETTNAPIWHENCDEFEAFILKYRDVLEKSEEHAVSEDLIKDGRQQVASLAAQLIEKRRAQEEARLKVELAKKKKADAAAAKNKK